MFENFVDLFNRNDFIIIIIKWRTSKIRKPNGKVTKQ